MLVADDPQLVRRIERGVVADSLAIVEAARLAWSHAAPEARPWAGGLLVALGPGRYINRAVGAGIGVPVDAADLDEAGAFFAARSLPLEVEVCPSAHPSLLDALRARGHSVAWFRQVLARRLSPADGDLDTGALTVTAVTAATEAVWRRVRRDCSGFTGADAHISDEFSRAAAVASGHVHLLGEVDGGAIGAASLTIRDGLAHLGGAGTVPTAQGRGVQGALIRARIALAARAGCDLVAASADPGTTSARNLERHGFAVLYTQLGVLVDTGRDGAQR